MNSHVKDSQKKKKKKGHLFTILHHPDDDCVVHGGTSLIRTIGNRLTIVRTKL